MRGSGRDLVVHGVGVAVVEIGNSPPLLASGIEPDADAPIKSAVSPRWLTGTVLTGVTSIMLMGAALVMALNGPHQFASLPDASLALSAGTPDAANFGQKGDRIRPVQTPVATRQVIQVSTVARQGDHNLVKLVPFAKISTTLVAPTDAVAKQIPAFDMLNIMGTDTSAAGAGSTAAPAPPPQTALDDPLNGPRVDGQVSVQVSDFPVAAPELDPAVTLSTADVQQMVRAAANSKGGSGPSLAYLNAGPATPDPTSLAVRIEIENVSSVAKTGQSVDDGVSEKVVTVATAGDLGAVLQANGIAQPDAGKVVAALDPLLDVAHLKVGEKVRLGFGPADPAPAAASVASAQRAPVTPPPKLIRASVYQDGAHLATVARADSGNFIRADEPTTPLAAVAAVAPPKPDPGAGSPRIYDAVYATALQQQVPKPLVDQLIKIFAFDVDLTARISPGDSMQLFHSLPDTTDASLGDPEILFASLTLGGVTKRFYRYRTSDDGAVDYYDASGQSAKKFLLRKPIVDGEITSGFGYRIHPILGERILHTGVDYAADRLTPIFAAGDGVVEEADVNGGYGNFILIKHTNGYETGYGHQTKFATGMKPGVVVHQGQLIGYVGSTGLSTGPHVHFEIRINGTPVDPLRVRLPQGRELSGNVLTAFETERGRIDSLIGLPANGTPSSTAVVASN